MTITRRLLEDWVAQAPRWLYRLQNDGESICYGLGHHGHWAMQAHDTAFTAFAVLAADPETDTGRTGLSRDGLTATALAMLRFTLRSHYAGGACTTDLKPWGHSWISALGLERMMHGVRAIRFAMTPDDCELQRRVLLSEADWLLESWPVTAGLTKDNHPESNMWNGTFLHRVARLYPEAPQTAAYLEKGSLFLANAVSIPEDASDTRMLDGRALKDWHLGPNFTATFGCNHHGYLNVGYMVITLSNLAMFHFSCREEGWTPPETLYLHARELWRVVKTCTFPDGRLWRIGGDSRVRYCYCQDYAPLVWLFAQEHLLDPEAAGFEERWIEQVRTEAADNGDGTFLGRRLKRLAETSPTYYYRLEGDKAASLSMTLWWHRVLGVAPLVDQTRESTGPTAGYAPAASPPAAHTLPELGMETGLETLPAWSDELHGASLVREDRRLASWCWRASEGPQGMCLPPDASDMAEWRYSLSGHIRGMGVVNDRQALRHRSVLFDGGFATCGRAAVRTDIFGCEGDIEDAIAWIDLGFAALPDGRTTVGFQFARLLHRAVVRETKGLYLLIPNDVHNRFRRRYAGTLGVHTLQGYPRRRRTLGTGGSWLSIDNKLGILALYGGPELQVNHPAEPQVTVRPWKHLSHTADVGGLLYADEICLGACTDRSELREPGVLFDVGFAIRTGVTARETAAWSQSGSQRIMPVDDHPVIRAASVVGADGVRYLAVANFGEAAEQVRLPLESTGGAAAVDGGPPVTAEARFITIPIEAGVLRILCLGA